jgi:putative transposase
MPRRARFVAPGFAHHITQRGNNREAVFFSAYHRRRYLEILGEHATQNGLRVLAWCLMTNHVHLIVIPPTIESLARTLGRAHAQYSLEVNRSSERIGHLWQNRFFSCVLDGAHLYNAMRYVELNSARAGLCVEPWRWPWSSAAAHSSSKTWEPLLDWAWTDWLGGWDHQGWKQQLAIALPDADLQQIRRATSVGEPLCSAEILLHLEEQGGRRLRVLPVGRPKKGTDDISAIHGNVVCPLFDATPATRTR